MAGAKTIVSNLRKIDHSPVSIGEHSLKLPNPDSYLAIIPPQSGPDGSY
jgi:hypothetical protein